MSGCITCVHMYMYGLTPFMYMYGLTPFCPSADSTAIGGTLWRTESHSKNRETLLEKWNLYCKLLSHPQFSVWLKTQTMREKKKGSNTWQERSFLPCNPVTPSLTLTQTFVFLTVSTMKASELSHWLLGCTAAAAVSRSSNWTNNQKGPTEQQLRCGFTILLEYSYELGKRKSLTGFRKSDNHNPDSRKDVARWEVQEAQSI